MKRLPASLVLLSFAFTSHAIVVYDNLTNNNSTSFYHYGAEEDWADDLNLASTAAITALEIKVIIPGPFLPVTRTVRARIFDRNGLNPPSVVLGETSITHNFTSSVSILRFEMPNVQPLSTAVWVALDTPGVAGLSAPHMPLGGTPLIGSSSANVAEDLNDGSGWTVWEPPNFGGNFAIKVEAVPEPATLLALAAGAAALIRRRRS